MTASVIIGSIFLSSDHLFWMEQLAISTGADLVNNRRVQIDKDCSGYMFTGSSFGKKRRKRIVSSCVGNLFRGHGAIGLEPMFEAVELPTGVAHLDSGLTNVDGKAFSHFELVWGFLFRVKKMKLLLYFVQVD